MKTCDLHTHSVFSDGTWTPREIIDEAERIGLSAVALTDHNTLAGLPSFLQAAKDRPVEAITGVEVTAEYLGKEVHILGLFVEEEAYEPLERFLARIQRRKEQANRDACRRLQEAGFAICEENILVPQANINRVHFARELVRCGYVSSVEEAFADLLSEQRGLYVPARRLDGFEVIECLRKLGTAPVLAHPFLNLTHRELQAFLPAAKEHGLLAMETRYCLFGEEETALAQRLTEQFGLLPSGGSDFHGENKPGNRLGSGYGSLLVPSSYPEELKNAR